MSHFAMVGPCEPQRRRGVMHASEATACTASRAAGQGAFVKRCVPTPFFFQDSSLRGGSEPALRVCTAARPVQAE